MTSLNISQSELVDLSNKKLLFFREVLQRVILNVKQNKKNNILGINDISCCLDLINGINILIKSLCEILNFEDPASIITKLQHINNSLSNLLKIYGSTLLEDVIVICFGNIHDFINGSHDFIKFDILQKYFHPTRYEIKPASYNGSSPENLSCEDILEPSPVQFYNKVHGIRIHIIHKEHKHNIYIYGILDDIVIDYIDNSYVMNKFIQIKDRSSDMAFINYIKSLSLKDYLIYSAETIFANFKKHTVYYKLLKQKSLEELVKEFIQCDLYSKRNIIIQFLINGATTDNMYTAYLLYDFISNDDIEDEVNTAAQVMLFDSFPWTIKDLFKLSMKQINQYTNSISNFDLNKIPLEQQICLLKTPESVKEKAMSKLKELKSKSDDSGSKSYQYLDGLLKIPFNIFIKEPILNTMDEIKTDFHSFIKITNLNIPIKPYYTNIEINKYIRSIDKVKIMKDSISSINKSQLLEIYKEITIQYNIPRVKSLKSKKDFLDKINTIIDNNINLLPFYSSIPSLPEDLTIINKIDQKMNIITEYIKNIKPTLDTAVYGHDSAKNQLEKIIAQWINGEQDGHCFGFEGPPGVGKTSLALKGIANCLKNADGVSRPISFIQMGGDSNGSTIHGHNYTYVGSTWGSIVQILMDTKCMNPIIFIDEIDKISKTEQGKEIIGILTHLLDPTQNSKFQDKYFNGIDIDMSKALFILSYNNISLIDKTLLDRIHVIKFFGLTIEDKLVILKKYIIPETCKKFGLENMITMTDKCLLFIIEEYTCEPGVRKLKEKIFEIIGEINVYYLIHPNEICNNLIIDIEDIKHKYLKNYNPISKRLVNNTDMIGTANGMWANSLGQGGVIPIQTKFYPCETFMQLKLTGLQGDVMKESMNIAQTIAWDMTSAERKKYIANLYGDPMQKYGIHIHTPEGAVSKDGPSAGGCITCAIYSLLNDKKIKHNIAITGEISLNGNITSIGGLDLKIIGSLKEGITEFIYPEENNTDFVKFLEKHTVPPNIIFHKVKHVEEIFDLIFINT